MKQSTNIKCDCGSGWINTLQTGRWTKFVGWWKLTILRDKSARFVYGPYKVVCSKCGKLRPELEQRNYRR